VTSSSKSEYLLDVDNVCRRWSPKAKITSVVGHLFDESRPGQFTEKMNLPDTPSAAYNVVFVDNEVAVEYDCQEEWGVMNYCVHFMSRRPNMERGHLAELQSLVRKLELNVHDLPFHATPQTGCWTQ
jgi:hypothetical protein